MPVARRSRSRSRSRAKGFPPPLSMKGRGDFNFHDNEGDLTLAMQHLPAELADRLHGDTLHMTEIYKGGVGFISSPLFNGKLPHGAHWLKIDLNQMLQSEGLNPGSITNGGVNPSQYLQYLKARGAKLSPAGHEVVQGVHTTRYSGTFDVVKASEQSARRESRVGAQTFAKLLPQRRRSRRPTERVDRRAHDLVRRCAWRSGRNQRTARATRSCSWTSPTSARRRRLPRRRLRNVRRHQAAIDSRGPRCSRMATCGPSTAGCDPDVLRRSASRSARIAPAVSDHLDLTLGLTFVSLRLPRAGGAGPWRFMVEGGEGR